MGRCEKCLNHIPVISENGMHYNCGLSEREALECLTKAKDHSAVLHTKHCDNSCVWFHNETCTCEGLKPCEFDKE